MRRGLRGVFPTERVRIDAACPRQALPQELERRGRANERAGDTRHAVDVRQHHSASGRVGALLRKLQLRDLVGLDAGAETIWLAYPFTERATEHRVELDGHVLNALCAIDALGIASTARLMGIPMRSPATYGCDFRNSTPRN